MLVVGNIDNKSKSVSCLNSSRCNRYIAIISEIIHVLNKLSRCTLLQLVTESLIIVIQLNSQLNISAYRLIGPCRDYLSDYDPPS